MYFLQSFFKQPSFFTVPSFFKQKDFKQVWKYVAWFLFALIIFLRLWRLDVTPPGFYLDEASIAYNGYTLLTTGQDEYGTFWPIYFKAFGEYKNPLYIYLQLPFFVLFGVSRWSSRIVAALSFLAAAGAFALLMAESLKTSFRQLRLDRIWLPVLVTTSMFLVLPWTFALGRITFEIATFPVFFVLSLFFLHRVVWLHPVSQVNTLRANWFRFCFVIGVMFYTYTLGRYISPVLLVLASLVLFTKVEWKAMLAGWSLFGLVLVPAIGWEVFNPGSLLSRYSAIAVHDTSLFTLISGYLSHFNPNFLFNSGDGNLRHGFLHAGPFLWTSLPFLLVGIQQFFKREKREFSFIILALVVLTPIPAMLTLPSPHVLRVIPLLLIISYFIGLGIISLWNNAAVFKFLLAALVIEAVVLISSYFGSFNKAAQMWFDADLVTMLEQTMPTNPAPYFVSKDLQMQTHISAQFVHAYMNISSDDADSIDVSLPAASQLASKTDIVVVPDVTEEFLLTLGSGTIFLNRNECLDFEPVLSTYYQKVWSSEYSCAWRHN